MPDVAARLRGQAGRIAWDLERFGLSPGKVAGARLRRNAASPVLVVSLPKSGTHLLERALCLHPHLYRKLVRTIHGHNVERLGGLDRLLASARSGQVLVSHLDAAPAWVRAADHSPARVLFMVRDPRDIVVSSAHYIERLPTHPFHRAMMRLPSFRERLLWVIRGSEAEGRRSVRTFLEAKAGWLGAADGLVRYEELVGPAGGGDPARQHEALRRVFDAIDVPTPGDVLSRIQREVFSSNSPTFRRGAIGSWREHFDAGVEAEFRRVAGDALATYGYA